GRYASAYDETPPYWLTALNGLALFEANDGHGVRWWRSDGTPSGTFTLEPAAANPPGIYPYVLGTLGDNLYFLTQENELWKTDGTLRGTILVTSLPSGDFGYPPAVAVGDNLYLEGTSEWGDDAIWKTDGTAAGTKLVKKVGTLGWLGT